MTDLAELNARLAALGLTMLTDATLAQLPAGVTPGRIAHALAQAEQGRQGALRYLQKHLPAPSASANSPPASRPPAADGTPATAADSHRDTGFRGRNPASAERTRSNTERRQCRVYGAKAALCVETDLTRQDEPTLRVEAALATAPRQYDWTDKIAIQLTREELPLFAATVLGLLARCECTNHGPANDKGLEVQHQGEKLFVRVFQREQPVRAVPVGPADSYQLAALCLRQLRKAAPWLSDQGVLAALKCTVQRMARMPTDTRRVA